MGSKITGIDTENQYEDEIIANVSGDEIEPLLRWDQRLSKNGIKNHQGWNWRTTGDTITTNHSRMELDVSGMRSRPTDVGFEGNHRLGSKTTGS